MKSKIVKENKVFNKKNNWQDFVESKPEEGIPCILYDSLDDNMLWVVYKDGRWVDARKGDWDIDPLHKMVTHSACSNNNTYETHLRYRFWKYIFNSPRLTDQYKESLK